MHTRYYMNITSHLLICHSFLLLCSFICTVRLSCPFQNNHVSCWTMLFKKKNGGLWSLDIRILWQNIMKNQCDGTWKTPVLIVLSLKKGGLKKKEEFKMAICRNNITRRMKLVPNLLILIEQMNNALNRTIWYIHTIQLHKQYRNGPFDGYKVYLALF